jgi:dTMP kinase
MIDGRFVALEGGEGSGKTTQAARLGKALSGVVTREPGGTHLGNLVRALLLDPSNHMSARTEALLLGADRAQHMAEIVIPTLKKGRHVVSDRSAYSSLAYQGYGRGLALDDLRGMNGWAMQGRWPDLVILLDLDPGVAIARLTREPDRIEQADMEFHKRVRTGFLQLAAADPGRWVVIPGTEDEDTVAAKIRMVVSERLGV